MAVVSVYIAPTSKGKKNIGGIARVVEAQERWLPEYGIDLVSDPRDADVLALHAAFWIDPKPNQSVVSHCHGLYWTEDNYRESWYYQTNKDIVEVMQRADAITVPTQWVRDSVARATWLSPKVIEHGIDLEEWQPEQSHGYVLWDKARADAACDPKPVNVLAAAMPSQKFVTTFGHDAANVRVTGVLSYQEHKPIMQHAGLYLATARETFGVSLLEAMACGVPIVGWNYGGQAELVDRNCGILVEPGDYDALKLAINQAMDRRDVLRAGCLAKVKQYEWRTVMAKYAALYESLLQYPVRVSVIIPSYNLGAYLPDAIESVLNQDEKAEIIVVDDCSTDGSLAIAQGYEGVTVLQTPVNSNMPTVLNMGIQAAHGKYILNLDADNTLPPGSLGILADILDSSRELDIVYGKIRFVGEDGRTPAKIDGVDESGVSRWPPLIADYQSQMNHKNQIPSSAMFRKKLWEQVGGYRGRCRKIGEDPDFWCRTLGVGAIAKRATDAITLLYRIRDTSRSAKNPEWPWEVWYPNRLVQRDGPVHTIDRPLVSVIIPVGPRHIPEDALDSLYAQTFWDWECIVVNDTGKDIAGLPSWCRVMATNTGGSGVSVARNIGLRASRGQAVVFLDADDYLADHKALEKMWHALEPNSYVFSDWESMDGVRTVGSFSPADQLQALRHPITCMFPIGVRDRVKFDESLRVGEDWDFVLGAMAEGYCPKKVPGALIHYRLTSGQNREQLKTNIEAVRDTLNSKWKEKVMACGCRGTGEQTVVTTAQAMQSQNGDLILLEFVKPMTATLSWTGPVTGHPYRFGSDDGHRFGYVHRADAAVFLERPEFELATVDS